MGGINFRPGSSSGSSDAPEPVVKMPDVNAATSQPSYLNQPDPQGAILGKFKTGGWADNLPPHAIGPFDDKAVVPAPGTADHNIVDPADLDIFSGRLRRRPGQRLPRTQEDI
jgi:hypothetical protein